MGPLMQKRFTTPRCEWLDCGPLISPMGMEFRSKFVEGLSLKSVSQRKNTSECIHSDGFLGAH